MMEENADEPTGVLENILASTAPAPATTEERHVEVESKVIKECIRQFTKGGMYFAYNFGTLFSYMLICTTNQVGRYHTFFAAQAGTSHEISAEAYTA